MRQTFARPAGAIASGTVALLIGAVVAAPAAMADPVFTVRYPASGSTLVAKPKSTVALGPAKLTAAIEADGTFSGQLPLPPTTASFTIAGLLPAEATVSFVPKGLLHGALRSTTVTAVTHYYIKLSDVTVAGLPALVGDRCQTSDPVKIKVTTPAGEAFSVVNGGIVAGRYAIGKFANCGLTTLLINQLIPGDGNTVTFTLGSAKVVS